jgi:glutamate-1-semialdehyde 2,1-aminomutase
MTEPSRQSNGLQERFRRIIPGGSHTYAKADDQYPAGEPVYITHGKGCHVWDTEGTEYIEYGMGLRAVTLGHAYEPVIQAAMRQMHQGANFNRPCPLELEFGEALLGMLNGPQMVKFAKNGSDANDAAIKLARAYTGRDLIGMCEDQPFFSVSDWFIGSTAMDAGIPECVKALTVRFRYNDLASVKELFASHPGKIAAIILEAEKETPPKDGFLLDLKKICHSEGALLILDEMITGFRWHNSGAQAFYGVDPDLSTFGKALGNGFSISALVGRREIMELGGIDHNKPRVFLLSTTHGAETHSLAAGLEVIRTYQREPVVDRLWAQGAKLEDGINKAITDVRLDGFFQVCGKPCCLTYATRDEETRPSQLFRTLFLQETLKRGLLAPSLVVSYSHSDEDIAKTVAAIHGSLEVYRKALGEGIEKYLKGRSVKPVFRKFN